MSPPPSGDYYDDSHQPIYHRADESYKSTTKRSLGTAPYTMPDVGGNQTLTIKKFIGLDDVCNNKRLWRMLIAETIGTFLLIFIGCGSCIDWREKTIRSGGNNTTTTIPKSYEPNETNGQVVHIALTFGIAVATIGLYLFVLAHVINSECNLQIVLPINNRQLKLNKIKSISWLPVRLMDNIIPISTYTFWEPKPQQHR